MEYTSAFEPHQQEPPPQTLCTFELGRCTDTITIDIGNTSYTVPVIVFDHHDAVPAALRGVKCTINLGLKEGWFPRSSTAGCNVFVLTMSSKSGDKTIRLNRESWNAVRNLASGATNKMHTCSVAPLAEALSYWQGKQLNMRNNLVGNNSSPEPAAATATELAHDDTVEDNNNNDVMDDSSAPHDLIEDPFARWFVETEPPAPVPVPFDLATHLLFVRNELTRNIKQELASKSTVVQRVELCLRGFGTFPVLLQSIHEHLKCLDWSHPAWFNSDAGDQLTKSKRVPYGENVKGLFFIRLSSSCIKPPDRHLFALVRMTPCNCPSFGPQRQCLNFKSHRTEWRILVDPENLKLTIRNVTRQNDVTEDIPIPLVGFEATVTDLFGTAVPMKAWRPEDDYIQAPVANFDISTLSIADGDDDLSSSLRASKRPRPE